MISNQALLQSFTITRGKTESLCHPLEVEDYVIQSMPDVSPPKWHLAHTTWFFETFLLLPLSHYKPFNPVFQTLFNSYYQKLGQPYPRHQRGYLARPTVQQVYAYRHYVDEKIIKYLHELSQDELQRVAPLIMLGFQHEQQHQELLLMDIKHNFSLGPVYPAYQIKQNKTSSLAPNFDWVAFSGGIIEAGHAGDGFCFDNELPRHSHFLADYQLANRLVTNGEYLEFIEAGGYETPDWWLSDGWDAVINNQWQAPAYWQQQENEWYIFTLHGLNKLNLDEPVVHVSYYEADAYARFKQVRLPSEMEWEHAATTLPAKLKGNFLEENHLHPLHASEDETVKQLLGDVWEWTLSPYTPYPGYQPLKGALGEYNGKFMSNQMVLRGGSCVTPSSHIRTTYRNFFQPDKRWQFSGIRLAK